MPRRGIPELTTEYLVICEGSHDRHFLDNLFANRGISNIAVLSNYNLVGAYGNTGFGRALDAIAAASGFESVRGIVAVTDSDNDPDASFRLVVDQIAATEQIFGPPSRRYPIPNQPAVFVPGHPSVGVITIPWHDKLGTLETLLLEGIEGPIAIHASCMREFSACVGAHSWPIGPRSKMQLRAFLASSTPQEPEIGFASIWERPASAAIPITSIAFNQVADFFASVSRGDAAGLP
jgi:hypothetical protein